MNKLSNPFGSGAIRITQTTHDNLGGTNYALVRAIDCNREPYSDNVFAEGDGTVVIAVNKGNPSSYIWIQYQGLPDNIIREFVHCRPLGNIKNGVVVKRGQQVGTIEPSLNDFYGAGKHHYKHLHWSFYNKNKDGAPNPFNYLDRTTVVISNYKVITDDRVWFNADGSFNWKSFGDYKLEIEEDPCKVRIDEAVKSITTAKTKEIADLNIKIKELQGTIAVKNDTIILKEKEVGDIKIENGMLINNVDSLSAEIGKLSKELIDSKKRVKVLEKKNQELAQPTKNLIEKVIEFLRGSIS